jgi:bacteriorhodopsin
MVTFIAGYHYLRIFDSFKHATNATEDGSVLLDGSKDAFNEAYRYVDWLLTVPLLLVEVIAVLALTAAVSKSQITYGVLSTIPFLYILYVLFVELGKSLDRQPEGVAKSVANLRLLLIATWGVYPIAYMFNIWGSATPESFVAVQVGYTLADVLAKCVFGLTILKIARMKSMAEGMKDDH